MTRPLAIEDLLRIAAVSDPQIAPDGASVAYVVETLDPERNAACAAIWIVPFAGGEPRQLTRGGQRDREPRWSPDGKTLAFVSDRDGKRQLYLLPTAGGEPVRLSDHATGVGSPRWSPDSSRLVFLADGAERRGEPVPITEKDDRKRVTSIREHWHKHDGHGFFGAARKHLWVVPVAGGEAFQLTDGRFDDTAPAWSPDGREIAFSSDRSPDRDRNYGGGQLHVVDVATGAVRRLSAEHGKATNPAWSPDGSRIAYVGSEEADDAGPADTKLFSIPVAGGAPTCLTASLGRSVGQRPAAYLTPSPPVWQDDGSLVYLIGTGGATHLWRGLEQLTTGDHATYDVTATPDGRAALLIADPVATAELFAWDGTLRQLTHHNRWLLAEIALSKPERVAVQRDGCEVEGWLLRPASATGPTPLVLSVHGGPHNYFGLTWNLDHQLYAAGGWAVLYVNPRGSGGYGEAFARAVIGDWGGGDWQDQLAALDHVIALGGIDTKRLAIIGSSYGGFMTCWAITQTDRFAVGVAGACISNLVSFYGTSDIGPSWGEREFKGRPSERLAWYLERSAVMHVDRVTTPLLLYHGEDDLRCPIEQSEQMFTALRRLGKEVEFIRLPRETHGALAGSPSHRIDARRAIQSYLARYLS